MFAAIILGLLSLFPFQEKTFDQFVMHLKGLPIKERKAAAKQFLSNLKSTPIIEQDTIVHFLWYGKAQLVLVNGNLENNWSSPDTMEPIPCGSETLFVATRVAPADSRLDYQLIVDGKYITDLRNPLTTPSGYGPHSELAMPQFKSTPLLIERKNIPHGSLDTLRFISTDTSIKPRTIKIYKPAGYENLSSLPSVYVHDGYDALNYGLFATILDNLIADKTIEPVVAIFVPAVEREWEYREIKHAAYSKALCDELVPIIDKQYHTANDPLKRATMGISDGGHIALTLYFRRPDVFGCSAGQSPTITEQVYDLVSDAVKNHTLSARAKLYFDVGTFDIYAYHTNNGTFTFDNLNRKFDKDLTIRGVPHVFHEFHDGHEWANWRERWPEILTFFFGTRNR